MTEPKTLPHETMPAESKLAETSTRDERVAAIAYQMWEDEGRPEGKAEEHWHAACAKVDAIEEMTATTSTVWLARKDDQRAKPAAKEAASLSEMPHQTKRTAA